MNDLVAMWDFLQSPTAVAIFAALWALSEALASIPAIKANSVFQLVSALLSRLARKDGPKALAIGLLTLSLTGCATLIAKCHEFSKYVDIKAIDCADDEPKPDSNKSPKPVDPHS